MKTPVIYNKDYIVYLENFQGYSVIHCDCFRWSKETKKNLIENIETLVNLHNAPLLAFHDKEDNKHFKIR